MDGVEGDRIGCGLLLAGALRDWWVVVGNRGNDIYLSL